MTMGLVVLPDVRKIKTTVSRCPVCLDAIPAEVFERDGKIVMVKACPAHGRFEITIANDPEFYYVAQGSSTNRSGSGCCGSSCGCGDSSKADPFDTLSTCVALIEIVDSCNLKCPTCYAASPWGVGEHVDCISVDEFIARVEGVIKRKGFIDIIQLTGGEPTIHPDFLRILEWCLDQDDIGYVLINTNGVRIAVEEEFRERLGRLRRERGKFELYVQFDGPQAEGQFELRGADLRETRRRAIDEVGALGVPSTLAMVVTPGTIGYLGDAIRFGLQRRHCRGVTFQPMFTSGRVPKVESSLPIANGDPNPISVGDVIHHVVDQSAGLLALEDFTPLPCGDPNCHTIGYLLRTRNGPVGLSRLVNLSAVKGFLKDRLDYRLDDLARCGCETEPLGALLKQFEIGPHDPFRLFIKPFMDAWTFDQDRIDRCCTHVIRPDGKLDSFCRYYLNGGAAGHRPP